ncbi:MAG: PPOX class F420-dependent oxidoreductase [Actinomycetota bacterium]
MSSIAEELAREHYVRLTTFRRDGTPVPTPVWLARDGDAIVVITGAGTGKVKRLRHTTRVLVAPCDARGGVTPGTTDVEGTAELVVAPAGVDHIAALVKQRYGVRYTLAALAYRLRDRSGRHGAGIRITFP